MDSNATRGLLFWGIGAGVTASMVAVTEGQLLLLAVGLALLGLAPAPLYLQRLLRRA